MDDLLANIPPELHPNGREIAAITDAFCEKRLNEEFRAICREMIAMAANAGVAFDSGKPASWAAGVVAAVGFANFLGDPQQPIHMTQQEMAKHLGVSEATLNSKAKIIRETLSINRLDPQFCTQRLNENNPFIWMVMNGDLIVDARQLDRQDQEVLYKQGQIPCIPADGPGDVIIRHWMPAEAEKEEPKKKKPKAKKKSAKKKEASPAKLYTLLVTIVQGLMTEEFTKKNPTIGRTIEIRGDQTLEDLHEAIFDAFDRDDPHMYEFQFGKRINVPSNLRYVMPEAQMYGDDDQGAGLAYKTTLENLKLKPKQKFWYLFDFGDDWRHAIRVKSVGKAPAKGDFPRVVGRTGESPPQYPDLD